MQQQKLIFFNFAQFAYERWQKKRKEKKNMKYLAYANVDALCVAVCVLKNTGKSCYACCAPSLLMLPITFLFRYNLLERHLSHRIFVHVTSRSWWPTHQRGNMANACSGNTHFRGVISPHSLHSRHTFVAVCGARQAWINEINEHSRLFNEYINESQLMNKINTE